MAFRDFIPADEMEGQPIGDGGYQDFVPAKKPVKHEVVEEVKEEPKAKKTRAKFSVKKSK